MKLNIKIKLTLFLFMAVGLFAQTNGLDLIEKAQELSDTAFVKADKTLYYRSIALCERIISATPGNSQMAYYLLGYNHYRLLQFPGISKNSGKFKTHLNAALKAVQKVKSDNEMISESNVLSAGIYMMKLSLNQSEAPALVSKIYSLLGQAEAIDSNNPRIYLIKGIMLFHTPEMFGGSKTGALANFNRALKLFENQKGRKIKWGYLNTLAWKGQTLAALGKTNEARKVYSEALKIEPGFTWVKNNLLPALNSRTTEPETTQLKTATLTVLISGLSNDKGNVRVALFSSKDNYDNEIAVRKAIAEIKNRSAKIVFQNIPFGVYAVKFYHDENSNGKLDTNLFGMPEEDYGFSNNATGNFGPASFEDTKFEINKPELTIEIKAQ